MFIELSKANEQGDDLGLPLILNTDNIASIEQHATTNVTEVGLVNSERRWVLESVSEVYSRCQP